MTGNKAYQPGGSYNGTFLDVFPCLTFRQLNALSIPPPRRPETVFAGKDASRALAKSSTKLEDVQAQWSDLDDKEKGVLNDWVTFFSKRYSVVGVVEGATNTE